MSVNVAIGVYRRKKEYRRMKVLILSCNTGEGHNSAGKAVKEYIESQGDMAEFRDMMMLGGKRTSKVVGGAYVNVVKHCPLIFALLSAPKGCG